MNTPAHTVPTPLRLTDILHPVVAGIVSVIVNYGGTFILVFQAAKLAGLSPALTSSWVWSVSIGVGLSGLVLSWYSREPVITAWSTPAAAFLVTALASVPYSDAIGAYLLSAGGFVMLGVTGYFERLVRAIRAELPPACWRVSCCNSALVHSAASRSTPPWPGC